MELRRNKENQAFNPYLPSYEYIADGEPRIFENRIYIFGSHDLFGGDDFCLGDYVCYSAPIYDLTDWHYEGIIYRKEQDPRNADGKMHMCAPDVAQGQDGRYYLYYQLHMLAVTSVAVCDTPAGKYEFYGYVQHEDGVPWGEKKNDVFVFDPGILCDDDGTVYLYAGFSPLPGYFKTVLKMRGNNVEEAVCLKLAEDMKTVIGKEHPIIPGHEKAKGSTFEGHAFYEASSPRKINGKYYLVYSSELSHELCYAISDSPDRGFEYGGTIISIGNIGYRGKKEADNYIGNTHGGMAEINGQWYIFYHRQTNLQKCARQACAEMITILPDGSIPQVLTTSCGLNNGMLKGYGTYEARIACTLKSAEGTFFYQETREKNPKNSHPYFTQMGRDRESHPDQYIANMRDGSVAGFRSFNANDLIGITIQTQGEGTGSFEVRFSEYGEQIATIPIGKGEGIHESSVEMQTLVTGVIELYFTYRGKGAVDFISFTLHSLA